ncbi:hypothetical protein [Deinococcus radiotolerans]|uniref:Serine protease n=1 Tax=Deinococcus radiotolerans TaxID=1309407 RepID=A0ABQ2FPR6_9DEIO|nr:hypothetical protein [Deinococcus radiotolerans]GGL14900.1 hypothetical protein GCM10010844_37180 [Deinococcus radiotolerans]
MTRDQFIRRATRGLWGQKKRATALELRGAIEDKIYRHQLCGMNAADAERAALRDLGSPHAIARDLNRVHTAPAAIRATLLLGVAGLLGMQAVAQVASIRTAVSPESLQTSCILPSETEIRAMSTTDQARMRQAIAEQGGPAGYLAACQKDITQSGGFALLRVKDVLDALKAGGVDIGDQTDTSTASFTAPLIAYIDHTPGPLYSTTDIGGERYIGGSDLIAFLRLSTDLPLRLTGLRNPVLQIGTVKLQLGTPAVPLLTTNLVAGVIMRGGPFDLPRPGDMLDSDRLPPDAPRLAVPGQDGDLYAVIQNFERLKGHAGEMLLVRARKAGAISIAFESVSPAPRTVTSLAELNAATAKRENAVMVYRVNATDLQRLSFAQVPAGQLRLLPRGKR